MRRGVLVLLLLLPVACHRPAQVTGSRAGPSADPSSVALCGPDEPGERFTFSGRVLDYRGQPLSEAAVIAYHAGHDGLYNLPSSPTRVPRLRGVAITGEDGVFRFTTVRPGAYPDGSEPAHVHLEVKSAAHHLRYVTYWFEGDPLITDERRRTVTAASETVIVELTRESGGAWTFTRDIRLEGN
jgi:protocatechuate 3,4-dioxygenase beta subunit